MLDSEFFRPPHKEQDWMIVLKKLKSGILDYQDRTGEYVEEILEKIQEPELKAKLEVCWKKYKQLVSDYLLLSPDNQKSAEESVSALHKVNEEDMSRFYNLAQDILNSLKKTSGLPADLRQQLLQFTWQN